MPSSDAVHHDDYIKTYLQTGMLSMLCVDSWTSLSFAAAFLHDQYLLDIIPKCAAESATDRKRFFFFSLQDNVKCWARADKSWPKEGTAQRLLLLYVSVKIKVSPYYPFLSY